MATRFSFLIRRTRSLSALYSSGALLSLNHSLCPAEQPLRTPIPLEYFTARMTSLNGRPTRETDHGSDKSRVHSPGYRHPCGHSLGCGWDCWWIAPREGQYQRHSAIHGGLDRGFRYRRSSTGRLFHEERDSCPRPVE